MNKKIMLSLLLGLLSGLTLAFLFGWRPGTPHAAESTVATQHAERKILYWYDPMKPEAHFEQPGKSPFMDMELIPRYAENLADENPNAEKNEGFIIPSGLTRNLGVKFGKVEKGVLRPVVEISGSVGFDEHAVAVVQARAGGIVERAYPLAVGDRVAAGAPLADVRVPEWYAAQGEYLALRGEPQLAAAARARLLQLGMTPAQVATLEKRGAPNAVVTFHATRAGMLSEFDLREGMTVVAGQTLARINGLDAVWVIAQAPEAEIAGLNVGDRATLQFAAFPGQTFTGRINALIPELDRETRTLSVRIALPNPENTLRPGMIGYIRLEQAGGAERLLAPTDAIIATGKRHVVITVADGGRFVPVEVTPGREAGGKTEILAAALSDGERIVVSGQFMIDSEASLRGVLARMDGTKAGAMRETRIHQGVGTVQSVDANEIVLAHDPIPELEWPAMTMPFALAKPELGAGLRAGQKVRFYFVQLEDGAVIERVESLP
ncbi:MAG: efflux RND transporter periplasmic adaptor subunit [Zoogloeaceae bacterium]|jgi:Cu(I)/Ag(I) efflux system membrane fusion protein|nr:efflux RND transporter periplasmic adaptor subunit [Zoogloeaceae bacterium]